MKTSLFLLLALASPLASAPDRTMTLKVSVDGMVCSFCAQGLVSYFKKQPAISNVHVDLTRKLLILEEKKGASITDADVTAFIRKSGFEPKKVERVKTSFETVKDGK